MNKTNDTERWDRYAALARKLGLPTDAYNDKYWGRLYCNMESEKDAETLICLLVGFLKSAKTFRDDPEIQVTRKGSGSKDGIVNLDVQVKWRGTTGNYIHGIELAKKGGFKKDGSQLFREMGDMLYRQFKALLLSRQEEGEAELDLTPRPGHSYAHTTIPLVILAEMPSKKSRWSRTIWERAEEILLEDDDLYAVVFKTYNEAQQRVLLEKLIGHLDLSEDDLFKIAARARMRRVHAA